MNLLKWLCMPPDKEHDTWYADDDARQKYGRFISINPSEITPSSLGLPLIGGGCFSMAFQLEDGKILRASTRRDPAYQAFLRLTLQRQDNPFYPRVFAAGFYPDKQMVVMEKLKPLSPEHCTKDERFLEKLNRVHTTVMVRAPASKIKSALKKLLFCRMLRQAYPPHKQAFRQLVADLRWLAKQHDFDLHGSNVMIRPCEKLGGEKRGGGQLVVIDPVC